MVDPSAPVGEVARLSLTVRLEAVRFYLPLAAEAPDVDVEHVHQLRVATRRALAALQLYAEYVPRRRAEWIRTRLRRMRQAAGQARDLDVLLLKYEQPAAGGGNAVDWQRFLEFVQAQRQQAQRKLDRVHRRLTRRGQLGRRVRGLLQRVHKRGATAAADSAFADWALPQLAICAEHFFAALPERDCSLPQLHAFRIAGKRLRYMMELLSTAFPVALREELYPEIVQLQEQLGTVNDHVVACRLLDEWCAGESQSEQLQLLTALRDQETSQLHEARQACTAWWDEATIARLRQHFADCLSANSH